MSLHVLFFLGELKSGNGLLKLILWGLKSGNGIVETDLEMALLKLILYEN